MGFWILSDIVWGCGRPGLVARSARIVRPSCDVDCYVLVISACEFVVRVRTTKLAAVLLSDDALVPGSNLGRAHAVYR